METKKCAKCGLEKQLSEFSPIKSRGNHPHSYCKKCSNKINLDFLRTKRGVILRIYHSQKQSSKRRNHPVSNYTLTEFREFALSSPDFHRLFDEWVKSGYETGLKPSFDRKDDYKGYSFDNFNCWMTWGENDIKGKKDVLSGKNKKKSTPIIRIDITTGERTYFNSISQAAKGCNGRAGNISKVINGIIKTSSDYRWERA